MCVHVHVCMPIQNDAQVASVLHLCCACVGSVLGLCWVCVGSVLGLCWVCVGSVLRLCCICVACRMHNTLIPTIIDPVALGLIYSSARVNNCGNLSTTENMKLRHVF